MDQLLRIFLESQIHYLVFISDFHRIRLIQSLLQPGSLFLKRRSLTGLLLMQKRLLLNSIVHCLVSIKWVSRILTWNGHDNATTVTLWLITRYCKSTSRQSKVYQAQIQKIPTTLCWSLNSKFCQKVLQKTSCLKSFFVWSSDSKETTSMEYKIFPCL